MRRAPALSGSFGFPGRALVYAHLIKEDLLIHASLRLLDHAPRRFGETAVSGSKPSAAAGSSLLLEQASAVMPPEVLYKTLIAGICRTADVRNPALNRRPLRSPPAAIHSHEAAFLSLLLSP